jgi:hypothetical protein
MIPSVIITAMFVSKNNNTLFIMGIVYQTHPTSAIHLSSGISSPFARCFCSFWTTDYALIWRIG